MTPEQFISTWKNNSLTERAGAQAHFDDLCELLGVDKPRDPDNYCFERGAKKASGGDGWADVWKRRHFGWENKKPGRPLDSALKQLTDYSLQLDNPPLLVVCDRERIIIHTAFTGYPDEPREIRIDDLIDAEKRQILRWVFTDPEKLRPEKSTATITAEAAGQFAQLAAAMRGRVEPNQDNGQRVAHFLMQCLFCMFAEDESLLPAGIFTQLLANAGADADKAGRRIEKLFLAMQARGGEYGDHDIPWFNGGLFKIVDIPSLIPADLAALHGAAADMDWRAIDPTIFGTLFERGLDPAARAPLGAHYTDTGTIEKLIRPVITEPLLAEWAASKAEILDNPATKPKKAKVIYQTFLLRLNHFRVLDPACGSGNFLYLALKALRDIEKQVHIEALELGQPAELSMQTGPHNILGIEINEFAAELARVTVWIGDIQWCRRNGYPHAINPILKPLDGIEHRDALLVIPAKAGEGEVVEAEWPEADVVVGNPPFLGDKVMRGELGHDYVETLRRVYAGRVPGGADLVTYWFEKARAQIAADKLGAAGLVATNSIRQKRNRVVLERILESTRIFEAWSDQDWVNEGAAVRVSLVCFGSPRPVGWVSRRGFAGVTQHSEALAAPDVGLAASSRSPTYSCRLDGKPMAAIHADLTGSLEGARLDLTQAQPLASNQGRSFFGLCLAGPFKVDTAIALAWLADTGNPNGRPNSDVVRPIYNGSDITRRWADNWVVDFAGLEQEVAADYLAPFAYVEATVKPMRITNNRAARAQKWWQHGEKRPGLRATLVGLTHYIATSETAKHRYFVKLPVQVAPEHKLVVIPRQDDATLGILSSRIHCIWALAMGSTLEDRPVYTSSVCFETFPFPAGFDLKAKAVPEEAPLLSIAASAADLGAWREKWLNPEGWLSWLQTNEERAAGFPPRPSPKPEHAAAWKKRTLTNLYNEMPTGLHLRHEKLDIAVAAAYGWTDYTSEMPDEEILRRLLALNLDRAARPATT
jgi:hypothetical protein